MCKGNLSENLVKHEPAAILGGLPSTIRINWFVIFIMYTPNETRFSQGGTEMSMLLVMYHICCKYLHYNAKTIAKTH